MFSGVASLATISECIWQLLLFVYSIAREGEMLKRFARSLQPALNLNPHPETRVA